MYTLCLLVMDSRHIGQMVNSDPQSLQVCNEITLVKKKLQYHVNQGEVKSTIYQ